MYKLKDTASRLTAFAAAVGLMLGLFAQFLPALTSADALNPLTQRSLTLSSSSPGWSYTDGSNQPWDISCYPYTPPGPNTCAPGYSPYAYPNSGANGQKTGNTFSFRVSTGTSATVKAFTFQYCTHSAGECEAPGDDAYVGSPGSYTRGSDTSSTSDLNIVTSSPTEIPAGSSSGQAGSFFNLTSGTVSGVLPGDASSIVPPDDSDGNFVVLTEDVGQNHWSYSGSWSMSAGPLEDPSFSVGAGTATGKNNYITLTNSSGITLSPTAQVKVVFLGTNTNYITNPGSGAFFVKINDYSSTDYQNTADNTPTTSTGTTPHFMCGTDDVGTSTDCPANVIDGGVTVANVMNQSIQIETKVLETMDFSVGTVDPDTINDTQLDTATGNSTHGPCDPILTSMTPGTGAQNFLLLGDQTSESSLSTTHTYGTYSFFRLSSNSTGGATVYYSGATLSDTEGDQLTAMGTTATAPHPGDPQFGLALDNGTSGNYTVDYNYNNTSSPNGFEAGANTPGDYENANDSYPAGVDTSFTTDTSSNGDVHNPQLYPLVPATAYLDGTGIFDAYATGSSPVVPHAVDTDFAFDSNANSVPAVIASESTHVVDCITGKVRYVANIAATTPAGIFTTKINYIASPQY